MSQKPTPPKGGGRLTQRANSLRHHSLITLEVSGEKKLDSCVKQNLTRWLSTIPENVIIEV